MNIVFATPSKVDLNLLFQLGQRLGLKSYLLEDEDLEDLGLGLAMQQGQTGEYIPLEDFLQDLKRASSD